MAKYEYTKVEVEDGDSEAEQAMTKLSHDGWEFVGGRRFSGSNCSIFTYRRRTSKAKQSTSKHLS